MSKNLEIIKELVLYNPVNKKIRLGNNLDGGYVIINEYNYDCFLSAGIADNISFEIDFIKKYPNIPGFGFDGTCNKPGGFPEEITYIKKNIGNNDDEVTTNLKTYVEKYDNIFIKMDIEGEEFHWIRTFKDFFPKVKQFVFEAHVLFPQDVPAYWTNYHCKGVAADDWENYVLESFQILNKTHYLVHVHENNAAPFIHISDNDYPSFAELTYIRKDCEINGFNTTKLPIKDIDFTSGGELDKDNIHNINFWPFNFNKNKYEKGK